METVVQSCQFAAAADQLRRLGIERSGPSLGIARSGPSLRLDRSGPSLRHEIVENLRKNADITELRNYTESNDIDSCILRASQRLPHMGIK